MEFRPDSHEAFLRHADFVRAIARSMLVDEHLAEDAAQEAWAIALEHPPRRLASLRSWLRTVARHTAGRLARTRSRHRRAEEDHAQEASVPDTADSAARNELLRRVTEELLELREPYRETLLLRYYHGWSPTQIAEHCDTTDKTIYSRLQRGLALLKERLDRSYGGERETWMQGCVLLLATPRPLRPWSGVRTAWGLAGTTGLVRGLAFVGLLSVVAASLALVLKRGEQEGLGPPTARDSLETARLEAAGPQRSARVAMLEPAHGGASTSDSRSEVGEGFVHGVVLGEDQTPVPGASIWVNAPRRPWTSRIVTTSDWQGRFRVPLGEAGRLIGAAASGEGSSQQQGVPARHRKDVLLRVDLPGRGGELVGCVRDAAGQALSSVELLWQPAAEPGLQPNMGTLRATQTGYHRADGVFLHGRVAMATSTSKDGRFRFAGVSLGPGRLWVRRAGHVPLARDITIVGGEQQVELNLQPGALLQGVVRDAYGDPVSGATVELGLPADPDHCVRTTDGRGRFSFTHVPPGLCLLHAFRGDIGASTQQRMLFLGGANWELLLEETRVTGRVLDHEGRGIPGWAVFVAQEEIEGIGLTRPSPLVLTDERGAFELVGIPELPFTLNISCDAARFHVVKALPAIEAGADLEIRVSPEERPTASIRGRIRSRSAGHLDALGALGNSAGLLAAEVAAVRQAVTPVPLLPVFFWRVTTTALGDGSFEITDLPAGEYKLMIQAEGQPLQWSETLRVDPLAEVDARVIWIEEPGWLRVDSLGRDPEDFEHFIVSDVRDAGHMVYLGNSRERENIPLAPGKYELRIVGFGYQGSYPFDIRSAEVRHVSLTQEIVQQDFEIVWPAGEDLLQVNCWIYGFVAGKESFLTGWNFSRERTQHLRVPLVPGRYRLEVVTSSGVRESLPLSVSRSARDTFRIDLSVLERAR